MRTRQRQAGLPARMSSGRANGHGQTADHQPGSLSGQGVGCGPLMWFPPPSTPQGGGAKSNTVQLRRASAGRVGLKRSKDRIEAQRTAFAAGIRLPGPRLGLDTGQNTWPYSTGGAHLNRIGAKSDFIVSQSSRESKGLLCARPRLTAPSLGCIIPPAYSQRLRRRKVNRAASRESPVAARRQLAVVEIPSQVAPRTALALSKARPEQSRRVEGPVLNRPRDPAQ
jgi:hypothetical protein